MPSTPWRHTALRAALAAALSLSICATAVAATTSGSQRVLDLPLEELLKVELTTIGRRLQAVQESAAAVFILTQDDIRRSGVTTIPDALRLIPGVQVGQMASNKWLVGIRGRVNDRFTGSLMVLMDGRAIFSPLYGGTLWEAQDTLLEDIERIEVSRGPAGATWGVNAVNGVINIVTKRAKETQGGLVSAVGANEERRLGARYGVALGEQTYVRGFAKFDELDPTKTLDGSTSNDAFHGKRAGFRLDSTLSADTRLSLLGDIYDTNLGDRSVVPRRPPAFSQLLENSINTSGSSLFGSVEHRIGGGTLNYQGYVETVRVRYPGYLEMSRNTVDSDVQYRIRQGAHDLMVGAGARFAKDNIESRDATLVFDEPRDRFTLASVFAQDDVELIPGALRALGGVKIDWNDFTGREVQPTLRFITTPSEKTAFWMAASRASILPARIAAGSSLDAAWLPPRSRVNPGPLPVVVRYISTREDAAVAVKVDSLEIGARFEVAPGVRADATAFVTRGHDRFDVAPGTPRVVTDALGAYIFQPALKTWSSDVDTRGAELALTWKPSRSFDLQFNASYLDVTATRPNFDGAPVGDTGASPRYQLSLRPSWRINDRWNLDATIARVAKLPTFNVPAYTDLDVRIAARVTPALELSLIGKNLLDAQRQEYGPDVYAAATHTAPRAVVIKAEWKF